MGPFRQWSRFGGNLPGNSIPKRLCQKQSQSVEALEDNSWDGKLCEKVTVFPESIAAEIDSMFDEKHLTGIGKLEFVGCVQTVSNDEFAGLSLVYRAVHGEEDKMVEFKDTPDKSAHTQKHEYLNDYQSGLK